MFNSLDAELMAQRKFYRTKGADTRDEVNAGQARGPVRRNRWLVGQQEVIVAVPLPALFVGVGTHWLLLAVADGLDLAGTYAVLHERLLCRRCAPLAQGQVVLDGAAIVAIAFDADHPAAVLFDHRSRLGDGRLRSEERRVGKEC